MWSHAGGSGAGRGASVAIGVAVVAAVSAAPADALSPAVRARGVQSGPFLAAAGGVSGLESTREAYRFLMRPDGGPTASVTAGSLYHLDEGTHTIDERVLGDASASRFVLVKTRIDGSQYATQGTADLQSGPLAGPPTALATCTGYSSVQGDQNGGRPYPVAAVSGDLVAYSACGRDAIDVRDLTSGAQTHHAFPGPFSGPLGGAFVAVRVAGRFLAVGLPRDRGTAVLDRTSGAEVFHAPTTAGLDLQDDGTLVTTSAPVQRRGCRRFRLTLYTPTTPATALPAAACDAEVRIAGGLIAFVSESPGGARFLSTSDLAGRVTQVAALGVAGMRRGGLDLDATRAAYALAECDGRTGLYTVAIPAVSGPATQPVGCPAVLRGTAARVDAGGRMTLSFGCRRGCRGRAILRLAGVDSSAPFSAASGVAHARLRLSPRQRAALPATGTQSARLTVRVRRRDGRVTETSSRIVCTRR